MTYTVYHQYQISKQHDNMLSSHLEILHQVKSQLHSHGEELQLVSSMVDKTKRLIAQFDILKKRVVGRSYFVLSYFCPCCG